MREKLSLQEVDQIKQYHVVFPTYGRLPLLLNETCKKYVYRTIEQLRQDQTVDIVVYKIVTDHIHLLVKKIEEQSLPYIVKMIKGRTTHYFFQQFPAMRIDIGRGRLWAKGYHFTEIKSKRQYFATIKYIQNNFDRYRDCL